MHINIKRIKNEIPSYVKLVIVSKGQEISTIKKLLNDGYLYYAENKVQEAKQKWPLLKTLYPAIKIHFIGHLQTNKVREAVKLFDVLETIDSIKLADKVATEASKLNKKIDCFIQVNIGDEPQKSGVKCEQVEQLVPYCKQKLELNLKGLMCIPPKDANPKNYYLKLKRIAQSLKLKELSMGMSNDYHEAIKCVATEIRLGRIIFENL